MNHEEAVALEAKYLKTLPLFVSIPRSGCNWIQPVLELYFDRHRVMKHPNSPSWMTGDANINPLWMHAHDNFYDLIDTRPIHSSVFLYRNPVDTIYSLCCLFKVANNSAGQIDDWCARYVRCRNKWINMPGVLVLRYEDLLRNPLSGIKKIHDHWTDYHDMDEFHEQRARRALEIVGNKQSVNNKNGPNHNFKNLDSLSKSYARDRETFRSVWGTYIEKRTANQT